MKILIVRVSSLGDVVHNMPMVADILQHYPGADIDWVVEESYVSLVRLNRGVRNIIPIALRRWRKSLLSKATQAEMRSFYQTLRAEQYDYVFDTQGLFKTSAVMRMARLSENGQRVGLANATEGSGYEPISRIFHTKSVSVGLHTHAVERARMVTASALGYRLDKPAEFTMNAPDTKGATWLPAQPYVVFFHGTARGAKRWGEANWIKLAEFVESQDMSILLPWGNEEELEAAQRLASQMKQAQILPKLPMMQAVLLAQRAAFVVGIDTGLTHIAAAFNRPTVEVYADSPRWKTEGNWSDNIINLGDTGKPPSVEEVKQALWTLMVRAGQPV